MEETIKNLLDGEIKNQIQDLSFFNPGSDEKSKAIDDLVKLYKLRIEEDKTELECDEKRERRFMDGDRSDKDVEMREYELKEQSKERYLKLGIAVAEIVLPLIFYASWMRKGFKFEETGTFTSTTFRGLFNRFRPTKK